MSNTRSHDSATKKRVILPIRVSAREHVEYNYIAEKYFEGNLSAFLRRAATEWIPLRKKYARLQKQIKEAKGTAE